MLAVHRFHVESKGRAVLRSAFDAYFPPAVVEKIMVRPDDLVTHAEKRELTMGTYTTPASS